ncbi:MAG: YbaN family protein [Defluviitaleaceae bacterium]|nr:YbaN family protein [Defluviitaleaceae bacterium]
MGQIKSTKLKKLIFIALGFFFVGLGAIGIIMPLLPTTPFMLLAAILFSKSSQRFHKWLLKNRLFGPYIRHYENGTGVPRSLKIRTLIFLWVGLISSAILLNTPWVYFLLLAVGIGVTTHIVLIKRRVI